MPKEQSPFQLLYVETQIRFQHYEMSFHENPMTHQYLENMNTMWLPGYGKKIYLFITRQYGTHVTLFVI